MKKTRELSPLEQELKVITQRLNITISLLADIALSGEESPISDKVIYLLDAGLPASVVADITNKPLNYITAIAHRKKRTRKGQKTSREAL